jgi:hypothetical protein
VESDLVTILAALRDVMREQFGIVGKYIVVYDDRGEVMFRAPLPPLGWNPPKP